MMFARRRREPLMRGEVTRSVRIWQSPRLEVGGRCALGRYSGFAGQVDLLKVAKDGPGEQVFLVDFVYDGTEPSGRST
jgi:hypothetical protein